jgi:hypothetical protein
MLGHGADNHIWEQKAIAFLLKLRVDGFSGGNRCIDIECVIPKTIDNSLLFIGGYIFNRTRVDPGNLVNQPEGVHFEANEGVEVPVYCELVCLIIGRNPIGSGPVKIFATITPNILSLVALGRMPQLSNP